MKSDRKEEGGNPRIGSIFELILPVHTKRSSAWITCGDVSIIISLYPFLFYRSFSCCCLDSLWINIIDVSLLSLHCQTLKSKIIGFPRLWFGVAKMLFWEFCSSSCVMFAFLYLFIWTWYQNINALFIYAYKELGEDSTEWNRQFMKRSIIITHML